jgi:hypothetical protein
MDSSRLFRCKVLVVEDDPLSFKPLRQSCAVLGFRYVRSGIEPFFQGFRLPGVSEDVAKPHPTQRRHLVACKRESGCDHFSLAYSILTCFSRGMLGSASFQRVRKSS